MDANSTTAEVAEVVTKAIDNATTLGESTFVILIVILGLLVCFLLPMLINSRQSSEERKQNRDLDREHKETIARSHEKVSEAVEKLADNDSRAIECQTNMQKQLTFIQERGLVMETVVDQCLAIAEKEVGSETISAEISRIRRDLEHRRV